MGSSVHTAFKSRFLNSDGIEYENFSERLNRFVSVFKRQRWDRVYPYALLRLKYLFITYI